MEYNKLDQLIKDIKNNTIDINEKPELIQFVEYEEDYDLLLAKLSLLKRILGYNYFSDNRIEAIAKKMQSKKYNGMFFKNGFCIFSSVDKNKVEIQKLRKYIILAPEILKAYTSREFDFNEVPDPVDYLYPRQFTTKHNIDVVQKNKGKRSRYTIIITSSDVDLTVIQRDEFTGLPVEFGFEGKEREYLISLLESYRQ
ncbi:hypothetical protein [Vreelandella neptunia]|uniref:Uncharacterized protein n=1 Tax=Vreelandella neptunia TaxID=115551 RepID=A0ABS9S9T0_9GAMM|nr:hypothetical protein [Halomonas neptunia]MCH4812872.1 hypothetical protein [Halomonas neptunia]